MKYMLQASSRIRFTIAMFAMLGAMWASIDLHQHKNGLHQLVQCAVCSIEKTLTHDFTLHTAVQFMASWDNFPAVGQLLEHTTAVFKRLVSIRAPPFA